MPLQIARVLPGIGACLPVRPCWQPKDRDEMRPLYARCAIFLLLLAGGIGTLGLPEASACSGPRASQTIRESTLIGLSLGAISLIIVVAGCIAARRRWIIAPLVFHPALWMNPYRGDCGDGLRLWSLIATIGIAIFVALVVCLSRPGILGSQRSKRMLVGLLAGSLVGLPLAALTMGELGSMPLAGMVLLWGPFAGALIGRSFTSPSAGNDSRLWFSLRALLLLPVVLAPFFAVLLPVKPYRASVSMTAPFSFVVVDEATRQPIPGASVQVIDSTFPMEDAKNQGRRVVTQADGSAEYFIHANIRGRAGLLGRTETTSYDPMLVRVEAPGYRTSIHPLGSAPAIFDDRSTDPPLGLTFPPPPTATIRLISNADRIRPAEKPDLPSP